MKKQAILHPAVFLAVLLVSALPANAASPDGAAVYQKWCAPCHAPGITHPGTHALQAKYKGDWKGVLTEWKGLSPDYVRQTVRTGISVMPQFRKTEISDAELDALARYVTQIAPTKP
jgi:mono/diheme cytochrome c family protein